MIRGKLGHAHHRLEGARPEQALSYLGLSLATTTVALLGLLQYTVIVVDRHLSTLL
jgi:hypothetical protein